jgi:hypothetical protein
MFQTTEYISLFTKISAGQKTQVQATGGVNLLLLP